MPESIAVSVKNVSKQFDNVEVLRDINLTVEKGTVVSILGSSGSGKSTLLRCMNWLEQPDRGEIRISGQRLGIDEHNGRSMSHRQLSKIRERVGMVFQSFNLWPHLTVQQNVALGLVNEALGETDKAARIDEYIRLVGLHGFERAYPHQLSGGMAQRVAIARGLVASPRLLLLDEPFSALDALTRQQLQEELLAIRRRTRITTLLVTHDVEEALYLADRVVVMEPRPGRIRRVVEVGLAHPRERGGFDFLRQREALLHELTADGEYVAPPPRRVENLPFEFIAC